MIWAGILVGCLGCYALKVAGLSVPPKVLENEKVRRISMLVPVALLVALIAVQTFSEGRTLMVDARFPGLLVAGAAVWRKWPFLVVVGLACATTAGWRLVFPGS